MKDFIFHYLYVGVSMVWDWRSNKCWKSRSWFSYTEILLLHNRLVWISYWQLTLLQYTRLVLGYRAAFPYPWKHHLVWGYLPSKFQPDLLNSTTKTEKCSFLTCPEQRQEEVAHKILAQIVLPFRRVTEHTDKHRTALIKRLAASASEVGCGFAPHNRFTHLESIIWKKVF